MSKSKEVIVTGYEECGFEDFIEKVREEKIRDLRKKRPTKSARKARKANPQQKMKSFFSTKKNGQGFPMHQCKYQPEEGAFMYHPPGYGEIYENNPDSFMMPKAAYCKDCKLQPCLVQEYSSEISSKGNVITITEKKSEADARALILEDLQKKHSKLFKLRHSARRTRPTQCMHDYVNFWHADTDSDSDSDSDDLLFGPTAMACLSLSGRKS